MFTKVFGLEIYTLAITGKAIAKIFFSGDGGPSYFYYRVVIKEDCPNSNT